MNLLPIPADALVGMFHPWRDFFGNLPFKNFILTDPVRQQYPWRELAVDQLKKFQIPWWNPYNFAGTPLLANIQSGVFYPLNILFFVLPFQFAWSIYILLAPLLAFAFMVLFLRNLNLSKSAAVFGGVAFALSGFNVAWLENGVLTHTLCWLPLILWSVDKKKLLIFLLSLLISFYAGHWQTFLYVFLLTHGYILFKYPRRIARFLVADILFIIFALPQLIPALQFISLSARSLDQIWQLNPGWFIPWQNLIQFVAPDFFGNPATLNYAVVFSYQEFAGYVGVSGLVFALSALFIKRKIVWFFTACVLLGLLMALPTPLAKLPFIFNIPLISSSMPTRLLSVIGFSLAVLAAFGFQTSPKKIIAGLAVLLSGLVFINPTKHLIIPIIFTGAMFVFQKSPRLLILFLIVDLGWFAGKFLPFSDQKYLYPDTKVTKFLQENTKADVWRFMALNDEIFPPNTNIIYRLQTVNGYDPLYLKTYGDLVGGGNRILTPKDYKNPLFNALGVKYILTFDDISGPDYKLVMQEGKTKVFENKKVLPRVIVSQGKAKITTYAENFVAIETDTPSEATLILSDNYYPGWKASVDGKPVGINATDYNFRKVTVPAGRHQVRFQYEI